MRLRFVIIILITTLGSIVGQKQLEKLPKSINTDQYDELGPVLSHDLSVLYFTRVGNPEFIESTSGLQEEKQGFLAKLKVIYSEISGIEIDDPGTSSFNQDIYFTVIENNKFGNPVHPGYPLNNEYPNSVCATSPVDGGLVVINQFDRDGGIQRGFSRVYQTKPNMFSFPKAMQVHDFNNTGNTVSLSLSRDEELMFIAMERPDSKGETDIYLSIKISDNVWSHPEPLLSPVNTEFRESAPFISSDKKRLYFASNRPGSLGEMDIYVSYRLDYTYLNWTEPRRLPQPINSSSNDSQPYLDHNENYLYFSSMRDGTSDIFRYHISAPRDLPKALTVALRILDIDTGQPVRGEIYWGMAHQKDFEGFFRTYNGYYEIVLDRNEIFKFKAMKRGYSGDEAVIDPIRIVSDEVTKYHLDLFVKKGSQRPEPPKDLPFFGKNRKITLRNIYFERSEAIVLPRSFPELGQLVEVLEAVPEIRIRIEGHTDNVGEKNLLHLLSERRAQSIKDYLVEKGIHPSRIDTIGFGDTYPLNDNATEEERKRNRRVEITVLEE